MTGDQPANWGDEDVTAWFEPLYADAARGARGIPWDRGVPHPILVLWAEQGTVDGCGRRAIVVGAGTGDDSAFVAGLGFETLAFDVSPTAVATARNRYPTASVTYAVADLFDPPPGWTRSFDLVVEIQTVQALPRSMRDAAIRGVANLVAPGGTVVMIAAAADAPRPDGPPWPLTREELDGFTRAGLTPATVDRMTTKGSSPFASHWLATFVRPVE